jgi:hypothetical protein
VDGVQERIGRGGSAAVVRHLEEVHPRQPSRQQDRVDFLLDVASQEEPLASIGPEQDD